MIPTGPEPVASLAGVATGIGSLPHLDPARAVALVLAHQPELPAAPSLPRRSPHESMLGQGAWGAAGMTAGPDGTVFVDLDRLDPDAPLGDPSFDGDAFVTLRAFLAAVADRTRTVKLQLTGPITLGLALHNAGAPADLAFRAAASAVEQRAALLRDIVRGPAVVFLDEPGLTGAPHPGFPISLGRAVDLLARSVAVVAGWAVAGIHCCGRADWRAVLGAGPRVLSLTVDAIGDEDREAIAAFVTAGGWIAWGAVPTDRPVGSGLDRLCRGIIEQGIGLVRAGCDPRQLAHQALITPACGLAGHGESQAEHLLELTAELAAGLRSRKLSSLVSGR